MKMSEAVVIGYGTDLSGDFDDSPATGPSTPVVSEVRWSSDQVIIIDQNTPADGSVDMTLAIRTAEVDPNDVLLIQAPKLKIQIFKQGTADKPKYNMSFRMSTQQITSDDDSPQFSAANDVSFVLAGTTYGAPLAAYLRRFAELVAALLRYNLQDDNSNTSLEALITEGILALPTAGDQYTGRDFSD
jgi:hypothetical protein